LGGGLDGEERANTAGAVTESLLIITGTMGAGKTTVLGEASDLLALRNIAHAAIDLDALRLAYLPSTAKNDGVMYRNLQSICRNYASIGVTRFLVARAIENRAELELCRSAVSASNAAVCRLAASIETMQRRVKMRESGVLQREYVARVANLNLTLDGAQLEDFIVTSEGRSVTEVAQEMLVKAEWISQ
jgi:adenylylsulfate kinase-like enzyme